MCSIEPCTREDFDHIVTHHDEYWESDLTLRLHHPIFIHEFGDTAYAMKDGAFLAAYLLGFFAPTSRTAYVHMVATHHDYRGRGLARRLYQHFIQQGRSAGCHSLKATAAPDNLASIRFHQAMGMTLLGQPNADGINVIAGYLKPGVDRVVFHKAI